MFCCLLVSLKMSRKYRAKEWTNGSGSCGGGLLRLAAPPGRTKKTPHFSHFSLVLFLFLHFSLVANKDTTTHGNTDLTAEQKR